MESHILMESSHCVQKKEGLKQKKTKKTLKVLEARGACGGTQSSHICVRVCVRVCVCVRERESE